MNNRRYVLSRYVRVGEAMPAVSSEAHDEAANYDEHVRARLKGKLALFDERRSDIFIINPVIKTFLSLFEAPRTLSEATRDLAAHVRCQPEDVYEVAASFMHKMVRRQIVVEEGKEPRPKRDPLFAKGSTLGSYKILDILSAHADADVYLAEPLDVPEKKVVLKVFKADPDVSEERAARHRAEFEQEFELMRALPEHENLCKVLAFIRGEPPYAVLEYVDGESVYDLANGTGYRLADRLNTAQQVLRAIAHLHRHQVIHGDVHDSNFLITSTGGVKLIDFGLSFHQAVDADQVVPYGGVIYFIPPECVTAEAFEVSKGPGNTCSEVHQLGVVLYALLGGHMPFEGLLWRDLVNAILHTIPAPLGLTPEGEAIPAPYAAIVAKALQKDPAARYPSAVEMSEAWERAAS